MSEPSTTAPDLSKLTKAQLVARAAQLVAEIAALKQAHKPTIVRSPQLEHLTLEILVQSVRQVLGWDVQRREDDQNHLDLGMIDKQTQERTQLARIEIIAWDMTGGLFDKDEEGEHEG